VVERLLLRIKVCGVTTPEIARAAIDAGADAIGLIDHVRSPRALSVEAAAALARIAGARTRTVGVFVDRSRDYASAWVAATGVHALQLCGREIPGDWIGFERPLVRRVAVGASAAREIEAWSGVASLFVLDHPDAPGGSGRAVDLELAAELARGAPCLLAGGLDAETVVAAIARVKPLGVDASSKLESSPGVKDVDRVVAFVRAARAALDESEVRA
jgi:phosphoribosylanthranilate isomerase